MDAPRRSGAAFTAFRIWDHPEPVRVHVREWQVVQHDLFAVQASVEDLQRFLALQPGPLATLAAMHCLRTCRTQGALIPHPSVQYSPTFCLSATPTKALFTPRTFVVKQCESTRYGMDESCAGIGLRWLQGTLAHRLGDQCELTLRLWRLGPIEPLGGWRNRDTMSTVRCLHAHSAHMSVCRDSFPN